MSLLGPLASATGLRLDPPLAHNFVVTMWDSSSPKALAISVAQSLLGDVLFGGFSQCSGLDMTQLDDRRQEGGRNDAELRFPTRTTWTNLQLTRGVSRISQSGWDWLYGFGEGKVKRMDGLVVLLDDRHLPHNLWYFKRAFPVKFTGPSLNGLSDQVAVEVLELAHEGLWQLSILKVGAQALGVSL
jgi:phage tail-like protein